jgi:pimeloyl-ACP methyl ester carboxylesterase
MATFDSNGFKIAYTKVDGSSRNVFFIHGNLASKEWWYPTMEILSQNKGEGSMVAADWRGYGESKGIESFLEINFETCATDVVNLIEDQKMSEVHLVGHSTGGLIAMMAVLQKPELFKSLTLLDSVGGTGLELELPKNQVLAHFGKMSVDKEYARGVLAATIDGCDPTSEEFTKLFNITWNCDKPMWQGVIDVLSDQIDITEKMDQINLPTLILHGDKDEVLKMEMAEKNKERLPNAKLKVMDNQGHSMNMENPKRLATELQSFWETL